MSNKNVHAKASWLESLLPGTMPAMSPVRTQEAHHARFAVECGIDRQTLTSQCKFSEVLTG